MNRPPVASFDLMLKEAQFSRVKVRDDCVKVCENLKKGKKNKPRGINPGAFVSAYSVFRLCKLVGHKWQEADEI